jgi:hypothetical protein
VESVQEDSHIYPISTPALHLATNCKPDFITNYTQTDASKAIEKLVPTWMALYHGVEEESV